VPLVELRRGAGNDWDGGTGKASLDAARGLGSNGPAVFGLTSASASSFCRAERRGGGRVGFGFSASCSSRADTKDIGEDGIS
jgi:hypothetical protein